MLATEPTLTFLGGTGEVTGSCYLVEAPGLRFLVDCGMFQGGREAGDKNRRPFPFDPAALDFVLLTHAHIDHSGLLPRLAAEGFSGVIGRPRSGDAARLRVHPGEGSRMVAQVCAGFGRPARLQTSAAPPRRPGSRTAVPHGRRRAGDRAVRRHPLRSAIRAASGRAGRVPRCRPHPRIGQRRGHARPARRHASHRVLGRPRPAWPSDRARCGAGTPGRHAAGRIDLRRPHAPPDG